MNNVHETDIAAIVARFIEIRKSGSRPSLDEAISSLRPLSVSQELKFTALRAIADMSRAGKLPSIGQEVRGEERESSEWFCRLPVIDGYDIIDEIGRGGMGVVYEAYQRATGRRVALKVMQENAAHSQASLRRFEREVELIARLQHPQIVPVIDSNHSDDRPWYAMDYIDGQPLDQDLINRPKTRDKILKLLADICMIVEYAHQRGVLHRDLKPSNILVDDEGIPHLLDFGLATTHDPEAPDARVRSLSMPGQLIGTLGYMAPEQSRGDVDSVSVRSDVYSLGALAYEMCTGKLPIDVDGPIHEVMSRISNVQPMPPSRNSTELDKSIDAILLKALSKESEQRYANAGEFAIDLNRYLNHEPILAKPPSALGQFVLFAKRHRATTLAVASSIVLLIIASIISISFGIVALHARSQLQWQTYVAAVASVSASCNAEDFDAARRQAHMAPREHVNWEMDHQLLRLDVSVETFEFNGRRVLDAIRSDDESRLMVRTSIEREQAIEVIDLSTKKTILELPALERGNYADAALSSDGSRLATVRGKSEITIYDGDEFEDRTTLTNDNRGKSILTQVAFSPDGSRLASGLSNKSILIWNVDSWSIACSLPVTEWKLVALAFSGDGRRIAAVTQKGKHETQEFQTSDDTGQWVRVWDVESGAELSKFPWDRESIVSLAFNDTGTKMAIGARSDYSITICDTSGTVLHILRLLRNKRVRAMTFSPDGSTLATGSDDNVIRLWNTDSGVCSAVVAGHTFRVRSLSFSGDGRKLISGSEDGTVKLWDLRMSSATVDLQIGRLDDSGLDICLTAGERHLVVAAQSELQIWDMTTYKRICTVPSAHGDVLSIDAHPDGTKYVVGHSDGSIVIWNALLGKVIDSWRGHGDKVHDVAYSPDGRRIASASEDSTIRIWTFGKQRQREHEEIDVGIASRCVEFSPQGDRIVVGFDDGTAHVYDIKNSTESAVFAGHEGILHCVAFSPDGTRIVSSSGTNGDRQFADTLKVWNAVNGKLIHSLPGQQNHIASVCFNPDGTRIASCANDGTIRIWDRETGDSLFSSWDHSDRVVRCTFTSDGTRLVSASRDGTVRIWHSTPVTERVQAIENLRNVRSEAIELLKAMRHDLGDNNSVSNQLWNDSTLDPTVQHTALNLLLEESVSSMTEGDS